METSTKKINSPLRSILLALIICCIAVGPLRSEEGMFLINRTDRMPFERMRALGLKLPPEAIYSPDSTSLKDAIVQFANGCTGGIVSSNGLLLTNHHCGYDVVQLLSSTQLNYLNDGFTAATMADELPSPELTVSFLRKVINVTDTLQRVASTLNSTLAPESLLDSIANVIALQESRDGTFQAEVMSFFERTEYYLMVYEVYTDVRLVLAPPSYVGKFGGDTDNWMWPRHTGDFMLFRVYADANGRPADYSPSNTPLTTPSHLNISLDGYHKGDLTLTIGYPGSTTRNLTSWGIEEVMKGENTPRVEFRELKQEIWKRAMDSLPELKLKYAATFSGSANYWKYGIGQNEAVEKVNLIAQLQQQEQRFAEWADSSGNPSYRSLLPQLKEDHQNRTSKMEAITLIQEAFMNSSDLLAASLELILFDYTGNDTTKRQLTAFLDRKYSNVDLSVDKQLLAACLKEYKKRANPDYLPDIYELIYNKFKGDIDRYVQHLYKKSLFTDRKKLEQTIFRKGLKAIEKDPFYQLAYSVQMMTFGVIIDHIEASSRIEDNSRALLLAKMKQFPDSVFYPDANFTMRLSYGTVQPLDGGFYHTTADQIIPKIDPTNEEFHVGEPLIELLRKKEFAPYADSTGNLPVALLSTNDITGGNSGSPLLNNEGKILGLAFDGNWEGMSGDLYYNIDKQRTISVDIRYVLFIIDRLCSGERLIKEMLNNE